MGKYSMRAYCANYTCRIDLKCMITYDTLHDKEVYCDKCFMENMMKRSSEFKPETKSLIPQKDEKCAKS